MTLSIVVRPKKFISLFFRLFHRARAGSRQRFVDADFRALSAAVRHGEIETIQLWDE
jgi:hypothetical protein